MSDEQTIEILNRLLQAEYANLIPRLGEGEPFVGLPAVQGRAVLARLVADGEVHQRDLAELILRLHGAPISPRRSMASGNIHYIDLTHLLPDIVAAVRELVETYESAGNLGHAEAIALIARSLADHQRNLAELENLPI